MLVVCTDNIGPTDAGSGIYKKSPGVSNESLAKISKRHFAGASKIIPMVQVNRFVLCHGSSPIAQPWRPVSYSRTNPYPTERTVVVLPSERPELRRNLARAGSKLCHDCSQHRTLRQPQLLGSGVSLTHVSSERILSIEEQVRAISLPKVDSIFFVDLPRWF